MIVVCACNIIPEPFGMNCRPIPSCLVSQCSVLLQVYSTIDGAIDRFKKQPINPEMQQAMPSHPQPAYQYPATGTAAAPHPDPAYQAAAAGPQYAGVPYDANAYASGQYAAYPQQYQQPYAAAAANGTAAAQPGMCSSDLCVRLHVLLLYWQRSLTAARHIDTCAVL